MGSSKLVEALPSGLLVGHVELGHRGKNMQAVSKAVHDGDTIATRALGNIPIRMLGIDTAEISFQLPAGGAGSKGWSAFKDIGCPEWQEFLADPLAGWPEAKDVLGSPLVRYLKGRFGADTALNHARHAEAAHQAFAGFVEQDVGTYAGGDRTKLRLFLRYARDVIDRYGRLLAYVNVDLPDADERPLTYNERMLEIGLATPYFIWPNVDPFKRQQPRLLDAVPLPGAVEDLANTGSLGKARAWVSQARRRRRGTFDAADPLVLYPFELRFLAGRRAPDRWVIDLNKSDGILHRPKEYYRIAHPEDRLYVPDEYVMLFEARGWKRA